MQPEARLVKNLKAYVVGKGGRPVKIWGSDEGFQEVGIADLLICYKGYFVAWEVKMPGAEDTTSPKQRRFLASIRTAGGVAEVITSVAEAEASLSKIDRLGG